MPRLKAPVRRAATASAEPLLKRTRRAPLRRLERTSILVNPRLNLSALAPAFVAGRIAENGLYAVCAGPHAFAAVRARAASGVETGTQLRQFLSQNPARDPETPLPRDPREGRFP